MFTEAKKKQACGSSRRKLMSFLGSVSTASTVHARDGSSDAKPIAGRPSQWSIVRHRASALIARQTAKHIDCDIRAEFGSKRRILRRLWNVEPIAIHNIASRGDGPENIISGHLLPDRFRA